MPNRGSAKYLEGHGPPRPPQNRHCSKGIYKSNLVVVCITYLLFIKVSTSCASAYICFACSLLKRTARASAVRELWIKRWFRVTIVSRAFPIDVLSLSILSIDSFLQLLWINTWPLLSLHLYSIRGYIFLSLEHASPENYRWSRWVQKGNSIKKLAWHPMLSLKLCLTPGNFHYALL